MLKSTMAADSRHSPHIFPSVVTRAPIPGVFRDNHVTIPRGLSQPCHTPFPVSSAEFIERPRPGRPLRNRPRRRPHPGLHARGHPGHGEGHHARPAGGDRPPGDPGQHLPPGPAARRRAGARPGRPARLHGLGRARSSRIPAASRSSPWPPCARSRRRAWPSRATSTAPRHFLSPGAQHGDPAQPGLGHRHGPGRVPAGAPGARAAGALHGPHHPLAGALPRLSPGPAPGPLRHQPGRRPPGPAHAATWRRSWSSTRATPFQGFAVGGLSVGEPKEEMNALLAAFVRDLPADRPRYLMGVGTPEDLLFGIEHGRGPLRLRPAHPGGPPRHACSPAGAGSRSRTPGTGSRPSPWTRTALATPAGLSPAPTCTTCSGRGAAGINAQQHPQPELHCWAHPRRAAGPAGGPVSGLRPAARETNGTPRSLE